jgi:hypothetical protein
MVFRVAQQRRRTRPLNTSRELVIPQVSATVHSVPSVPSPSVRAFDGDQTTATRATEGDDIETGESTGAAHPRSARIGLVSWSGSGTSAVLLLRGHPHPEQVAGTSRCWGTARPKQRALNAVRSHLDGDEAARTLAEGLLEVLAQLGIEAAGARARSRSTSRMPSTRYLSASARDFGTTTCSSPQI